MTLGNVSATEEELKRARAILDKASEEDRQKVIKSKMACMKQWLKANKDDVEDAEKVLESRNDERRTYLEAFLVHTMRCEDAASHKTITKSTVEETKKVQRFYEWSEETMDDKLGPIKAQLLRESGKLSKDPCPITGSDHPKLVVWKVPVGFVDKNLIDSTASDVSSKQAATERDLQLLHCVAKPDEEMTEETAHPVEPAQVEGGAAP